MSNDVAQRQGQGQNVEGRRSGSNDSSQIGPAALPHQEALAFLRLRGKLTDSVLIGLNQGLVTRQLVSRVVKASEAGAKLAANVDVRGRTLRDIVKDPAFDWGEVAKSVGNRSDSKERQSTKTGAKPQTGPSRSNEDDGDKAHATDAHRGPDAPHAGEHADGGVLGKEAGDGAASGVNAPAPGRPDLVGPPAAPAIGEAPKRAPAHSEVDTAHELAPASAKGGSVEAKPEDKGHSAHAGRKHGRSTASRPAAPGGEKPAVPMPHEDERHRRPELHRSFWETVVQFWKSDELIIQDRLREYGTEMMDSVSRGERTPAQAAAEYRKLALRLEGDELSATAEATARIIEKLGSQAADEHKAAPAQTKENEPASTGKEHELDHGQAKARQVKSEGLNEVKNAQAKNGGDRSRADKNEQGAKREALGNQVGQVDANAKPPKSRRMFANSFEVVDETYAQLKDGKGKDLKPARILPVGTRVFVHRAEHRLVHVVTADQNATPTIKLSDNLWIAFAALGGRGSDVALGNDDDADKKRAEELREHLPPGRNPGKSQFKWGFSSDFSPELDGVALESSLMAKVHLLMEWAIQNDMVTNHIVIKDGMRSPREAHKLGTSYEIQNMDSRHNVTMESLKALPEGRDKFNRVWYQPNWNKDEIVKNAKKYKKGDKVAAGGFPVGHEDRAPLVGRRPGVSRHCTGRAVDVTIPWRNAEGDGEDVWAWEKIYLQFGLFRPLHKDRVSGSQQEPWHIEETSKQIVGANEETDKAEK